jgi:HPt (histidine-containing phosphotransfer) domain-containing protein
MLERLMNDEQLAQLVTKTFLFDIPRQIEPMRDHLENSNIARLARLAHTIKGAAANVGGEALSALASEIEKPAMPVTCVPQPTVWVTWSESLPGSKTR